MAASSFSSCKSNERSSCPAAPRTASIMNRIVASSLGQPLLVVLMTLMLDRRGNPGAGPPAGGRLSRSFAAHGRDHHPMARPCGRRSGTADHRARRTGDERHPADDRRCARSRSTDCRMSSSLSRTAPTTISPASRSSTGWPTSVCPSGVTPSVSPLTSPSGLIYRYVLQSPDRSPMELKTFEDWIVEPQYQSVPGVADDSGFGGGTMQYQVLLDPAKIAGVGLSVAQVETALARQQRQCRRRILFAGRPVLLRARHGAHRTRWRTSAMWCWRCTTAPPCW